MNWHLPPPKPPRERTEPLDLDALENELRAYDVGATKAESLALIQRVRAAEARPWTAIITRTDATYGEHPRCLICGGDLVCQTFDCAAAVQREEGARDVAKARAERAEAALRAHVGPGCKCQPCTEFRAALAPEQAP